MYEICVSLRLERLQICTLQQSKWNVRLAIVKRSKPLTTTKIAKVEDNPNAQIAINQQGKPTANNPVPLM